MSPVTDPRIARIERGIALWTVTPGNVYGKFAEVALADLHAWQEIAERHKARTVQTGSVTHGGGPQYGQVCRTCRDSYGPSVWPCPDRQAADAALDRLDALWGTDD